MEDKIGICFSGLWWFSVWSDVALIKDVRFERSVPVNYIVMYVRGVKVYIVHVYLNGNNWNNEFRELIL